MCVYVCVCEGEKESGQDAGGYVSEAAASRHGRGPALIRQQIGDLHHLAPHVPDAVHNLRTTASQKCEAVPRRARM